MNHPLVRTFLAVVAAALVAWLYFWTPGGPQVPQFPEAAPKDSPSKP